MPTTDHCQRSPLSGHRCKCPWHRESRSAQTNQPSLTQYNVAISVAALFVLLAKMIATIMKVFYPILGTIVGIAMTALFTVSVYGQMGPDHSDSRYPSSIAWYIRLSCDIARPYNSVRNCQMSKGAFSATVLLL